MFHLVVHFMNLTETEKGDKFMNELDELLEMVKEKIIFTFGLE